MKRMIGRLLRHQVRRVKKFLERLAPEPEPGPYNSINPAFAYASINKTLTTLMSEHRGLYPQYTWGVLQAAHLAATLGIRRISVIEFGVAGGNGLVALERASERAEAESGVQIDVHGFDTGTVEAARWIRQGPASGEGVFSDDGASHAGTVRPYSGSVKTGPERLRGYPGGRGNSFIRRSSGKSFR